MVHFNPRSPCGERRRYTIVKRYSLTVNFNPRSPCGERQMGTGCSSSAAYFNPRSPCGERLSIVITIKNYIMQFQSTLHVRGATNSLIFSFNSLFSISIHAPRAGSDGVHFGRLQRNKNFNPRSPCGERRCVPAICCLSRAHFNPRSPCGERLIKRCNIAAA